MTALEAAERARPGEHLVLLTNSPASAIEGRLAGLELRDCLLVLRPGPTASFVFLFRKSLIEDTLADQVVKTGTGTLNIAACRIGTVTETHSSGARKERVSMNKGMVAGTVAQEFAHGRWPPNVVLIHTPTCVRTGTKRLAAASGVPKNAPITATRQSGAHADAGGHQAIGRVQPVFGYGDDDGTETVAAYDCALGCPVPILDALSGDRPGAYRNADLALAKMNEQKACAGDHNTYGKGLDTKPAGTLYSDTGGASRFFPQFESEPEFFRWLGRLLA